MSATFGECGNTSKIALVWVNKKSSAISLLFYICKLCYYAQKLGKKFYIQVEIKFYKRVLIISKNHVIIGP